MNDATEYEQPSHCDVCSAALEYEYIDGKTRVGPWASMCTDCFYMRVGVGHLGTGCGQLYRRDEDGHWAKAGG